MQVLLCLVFCYGITDTHIHCIFFNSDIFQHVRSKTTQSPELKYMLHREIMCVLLLHFLPMMSSFSTSFSDHDCMLECFYKTVSLNSNIIIPTSESYFRAHKFVYKQGVFSLEHHLTLRFHLLFTTKSFNTLWPILDPSQVSFIRSRVQLRQHKEAGLVSSVYAIISWQTSNTD